MSSSSKNMASDQRREPRLTPSRQDAQARNKDPYKEVDSSDSDFDMRDKRFDWYGNESYEATQMRRHAAIILDNPELLMMQAAARGDSIPATRLYFRNLMCGYITSEDKPKKQKSKSQPGEKSKTQPEEKSVDPNAKD